MNCKQTKWIIGIGIIIFIFLIADLDKLKSIADILGGIGSFLAFGGAVWLWQKSENTSKINEANANFLRWYSLCLSCQDINSPQNYLSMEPNKVYLPDFKEFDNLVYLYELHFDKTFPQTQELEDLFKLIRQQFTNAIKSGWKRIDEWAQNAIKDNCSQEMKILEQNGQIPNLYNLLNFKHVDLHHKRFDAFRGGYSHHISQNSIDFISLAAKITEFGKLYSHYLQNKINLFK